MVSLSFRALDSQLELGLEAGLVKAGHEGSCLRGLQQRTENRIVKYSRPQFRILDQVQLIKRFELRLDMGEVLLILDQDVGIDCAVDALAFLSLDWGLVPKFNHIGRLR